MFDVNPMCIIFWKGWVEKINIDKQLTYLLQMIPHSRILMEPEELQIWLKRQFVFFVGKFDPKTFLCNHLRTSGRTKDKTHPYFSKMWSTRVLESWSIYCYIFYSVCVFMRGPLRYHLSADASIQSHITTLRSLGSCKKSWNRKKVMSCSSVRSGRKSKSSTFCSASFIYCQHPLCY